MDTKEPLLERKYTYATTTNNNNINTTIGDLGESTSTLERRITFARTLTFNLEAFDPAVYEGYVSAMM